MTIAEYNELRETQPHLALPVISELDGHSFGRLHLVTKEELMAKRFDQLLLQGRYPLGHKIPPTRHDVRPVLHTWEDLGLDKP